MLRVCYERVFHYLHTPPSKVPFYVQNLVFILLMTATLHVGLVLVWTVSLLMVALVLFMFKRVKRHSLLTGLVKITAFDECTFAPLTLVSQPSINLVTGPNLPG